MVSKCSRLIGWIFIISIPVIFVCTSICIGNLKDNFNGDIVEFIAQWDGNKFLLKYIILCYKNSAIHIIHAWATFFCVAGLLVWFVFVLPCHNPESYQDMSWGYIETFMCGRDKDE